MKNENSPAGSATGIDLDREQFTAADLADIEALAAAAPKVWYGTHQIADGITDEAAVALIEACSPDTVLELIALARATPQHSVTEQASEHEAFKAAMVTKHYVGSMFDYFLAEGEITYHDPVANQMYDAWQAARAQPLASTAATQLEQAPIKKWQERIVDGVFSDPRAPGFLPTGASAIMAAMAAENDDLRAALAIPASTALARHPTLIQALETGNDRESPNWFDIKASEVQSYTEEGYKVRELYEPASTAASEQQASVSDERPTPPVLSDERRAEAMERYGTGVLPWSCRIPPNQSARVIADAMQDELNELRPLVKSARAALSGRATIPSEADERADFEAQARRTGHENFMRMAGDPETYDDMILRAEYRGWRAALTRRATTAGEEQCWSEHVQCQKCGLTGWHVCRATTAADQQGEAYSTFANGEHATAGQQGDTASAAPLPARRKPHTSEPRDQAHAAGWNACLDAIAQQGAAQAQAGEMARGTVTPSDLLDAKMLAAQVYTAARFIYGWSHAAALDVSDSAAEQFGHDPVKTVADLKHLLSEVLCTDGDAAMAAPGTSNGENNG